MKSSTLFNFLLGTYKCNNNYYIEIYDIINNSLKSELIYNLALLTDNSNIINENKNRKNDAFCFNCKKNININESPNCNNHNIKNFKDLTRDINIELLERNLKKITDNYEEIVKIIEEKINDFKKRNNAQISLAKKLIETYKGNINNLNYQIISNTKNILRFNELEPKSFLESNKLINFDFNILKIFSVNHYLKEELKIEKIQKNLEIKFNSDEYIENFTILEKRKKLIFNIKKKLYMIDNEKFILEDKIESRLDILLINLMKDKETILISHPNSIEKLKIENNKIILENFLNNICIKMPGHIINYENEYAWTCKSHIGFLKRKFYNISNHFSDEFDEDICDYEVRVFKLFEYKTDILYIIAFTDFQYDDGTCDNSIRLGSYKRSTCSNEYIYLEAHGCISLDDFKIYSYKSDNIIIFGKLGVFIIDILNMRIIKQIKICQKLILNSFYLDEFSCFLIILSKSSYTDDENFEFCKYNEEDALITKKENYDMISMIIRDDFNDIILKIISNINFGNTYNDQIKKENNINTKLINIVNNTIEFYSFVDIKKSISIKDN